MFLNNGHSDGSANLFGDALNRALVSDAMKGIASEIFSNCAGVKLSARSLKAFLMNKWGGMMLNGTPLTTSMCPLSTKKSGVQADERSKMPEQNTFLHRRWRSHFIDSFAPVLL
jgi:hypothetical protein